MEEYMRQRRNLKKGPPRWGGPFVLVEAAGFIRPTSSPLRGRRRCAPALSRHFMARL